MAQSTSEKKRDAMTDGEGILAANWSSGDACAGRWTGVRCSADGRRVTSLVLPSLDLRGPPDPLSHLGELCTLDLRGNRLNALDALLRGVPNLVLLYLSHNDISGAVPDSIARLPRLVRVDLADNGLSGPIPTAALGKLSGLLTLKLQQDNLLTGLLPDVTAALPRLAEFNASNNQLSGREPDAMRARFGLASFAGNAGPEPPLPSCSFLPREPAPTSSSSVAFSMVPSNPAASSSVVSSSPALATPESLRGAGAGKGGLSRGAIAGIAVGNVLFFFALESLLVACCFCGRGGGGEPATKKRKRRGLGTVYRAVLRDANPCAREEFHRYMDLIGRLHHPHLVPIRAFYYAKQGRLLIYDYLSNGNLHGHKMTGESPLDWTTRVRLLLGAARSLACIHREYRTSGVPHGGNIKSTNVLLDKGGMSAQLYSYT